MVGAMGRAAAALVLLGGLGACAGEPPPAAPIEERARVTGVNLARLEIRDDNVDRFEHCPPPGEIGQEWVPAIPEWHLPAASASAAVPESAVGTPSVAESQGGAPEETDKPATVATLTDEASTQTRVAFRRCYHQGLVFDPTQDGHVAVVLHVDRSGKVAAVETWGACDLAPEALVCMRDEAARVKLRAPAAGFATVIVPAVFTNGAERTHGHNDAYSAAAYVAVEAMRPRLHACEDSAKREGHTVFASAVMTIDIDAAGRGVHVGVDQWRGGQEILACAAEAVRAAKFPPPPGRTGRVILPIAFNPRAGSR